ncbi:MAG: PAS domain S-box protein [Opitutaceae bacterium]|nr:PAS domain S-box protein [Opitutaceae bacterium]
MIALRLSTPWRITLFFALASAIWIVSSDYLSSRLERPQAAHWFWDSAKGLAYVGVTSGVIYALTREMAQRYEAAESAMRDSKMRWQFALEGAGNGMWDWNLVTGEAFFSRQCKALIGYEEHELANHIDEWKARIHPDDRDEVYREIDRALASQNHLYSCEYRIRCRDGSYKWLLARGQVMERDPSGRPLRFIGLVSDVSARRIAEQKANDTLNFVQAILDASPIGILTYRHDGVCLTANATAARMVGASVQELTEQNFRELPSWRDSGLLAAAERALASGEPVAHSGRIQTTFGRQLWVESRFTVFQYDGQPHLLAVILDETERKRAGEELDLLLAAVQAAPNGWVVTKPDGIIEWVNPAFTKITGYSFSEVVGRNPRVLKSGEHTPQFYADMWSTIRRGEVWRGILRNRRKDGSLYHEEMTIAPVRDSQGEITHFVALKYDISEQKRLEQQAARTQRLESIGLLASGIAHDLNNILAPVLLSIELLKIKYPTSDARKCIDVMENAAQRGAGIVKQVLTFARGIDGERTEVRPKYLLKDIARLVEETFPRNIKCQVEIAADVWNMAGDLTQLHQVLLNLAVNARDAMPAGGQLTLGAANVVVEETGVRLHQELKPGPYVVLSVADTGTGIPPDVLEHIFEPFYTTKPRDKGTGLGLSTVYGIVRSHGGIVEVKTELDAGTEFRVLLPASASQPARAASNPPMANRPEGGGRWVLVVDDEESIRVVTAGLLDGCGFVPLTAVDGEDGLRKYREHPDRYAAIITDIMMPQMNGYDFIRQVRAQDPAVPIIASSGMTGDGAPGEDRAELSRLGVNHMLVKPYGEAALLRALRAVL